MAEIENFYRALYSNQDDKLENVDLRNIVDIEQVNTLSEDMAQQLEGKLTYQEALQALKGSLVLANLLIIGIKV